MCTAFFTVYYVLRVLHCIIYFVCFNNVAALFPCQIYTLCIQLQQRDAFIAADLRATADAS